ncbi:MAG: T9SS type A sorting domain-containing protein [Bacteroidetes bacterium]|nr:T9SS type A sorting domain-containing protein [Bacteroidota bacterium]
MDLSQNIITSGSFGDSVYFEPKQGVEFLLSAGLGDVFIQKNFAKGDLIIKPSSLIDMHSENQRFIVSNPFGHSLTIEFNQNIEKGDVRLYDLRGIKVLDKACSQTNRLDLTNDLEKGVYMLELQIGEVIERRKLMRE